MFTGDQKGQIKCVTQVRRRANTCCLLRSIVPRPHCQHSVGPDNRCFLIWPSWTSREPVTCSAVIHGDHHHGTHYHLQSQLHRRSWRPLYPIKKSLEGQDVALLPPQARLVVGSHLATGSLLCGHLVSTEVTHSLSL